MEDNSNTTVPTPGTFMDAIMAVLKNPAGGGSEVSMPNNEKLIAGLIMTGIGLGMFILLLLIMGAGALILRALVAFLFIAAFSWLFNFVGARLGSKNASPEEVTYGTGITVMFLGAALFVAGLIFKVFASNSVLMIMLAMGISLSGIVMLGAVTNGVWSRGYGVPATISAYLSPISVGLAFALGMWLASQTVMGGGMGLGGFPFM